MLPLYSSKLPVNLGLCFALCMQEAHHTSTFVQISSDITVSLTDIWLLHQAFQLCDTFFAVQLLLFYSCKLCVCVCIYIYIYIYIDTHTHTQDFHPLQYSSWDGHAEGEHVNRGRDTPSFCPTLQVLDMSTLLCLSWLLRSRIRKFRRDLWITIYICIHQCNVD
jgi:hypothetical protein